jgi:hypothetical protein
MTRGMGTTAGPWQWSGMAPKMRGGASDDNRVQ